MKASIAPIEPVEREVTLTMTLDEARDLFNLALCDCRIPEAITSDATEYRKVQHTLQIIAKPLRGILRGES